MIRGTGKELGPPLRCVALALLYCADIAGYPLADIVT